MRPALAIVLSAAILLGVRGYLSFAKSLRGKVDAGAGTAQVAAAGKFTAEITLTFAAEADAFSLEPVALVFKQQQRVLLERTERVNPGEPIVVEAIPNVVVGANAFYFECTPADEGPPIARAVRVRLLRDGEPLADETLWSPPGLPPSGEITLHVKAVNPAGHEHDH